MLYVTNQLKKQLRIRQSEVLVNFGPKGLEINIIGKEKESLYTALAEGSTYPTDPQDEGSFLTLTACNTFKTVMALAHRNTQFAMHVLDGDLFLFVGNQKAVYLQEW